MSISIPQPFVTSISVAQPFRTKLEGIPNTYSFGVTALPEVDVAVKEIPVLRLSVDNVAPIEIRLTEIPSVRTHIPADFAVSFSMLGLELGAIRLCGEAQVITEPYRPNPCETCGTAVIRPIAGHVAAPIAVDVAG